MRGHLWTLGPHVVDAVIKPKPFGRAWSASIPDDRFGQVRVTGRLDRVPGAREALVVVHGMGGNAEKGYILHAARAAKAMGLTTLRLTLRGCDQAGEDVYHAGLVADLQAAVNCPELADVDNIYVLGFSLGGHMVMRFCLSPSPRVRAAAAICSPLDLDLAARYIDTPGRTLYRAHLLNGLRAMGRSVEVKRGVRLADKPLKDIRSIREWDDKVTAARFGFSGVDDYYASTSVLSQASEISVPMLLVFGEQDPMVSSHTIRTTLSHLGPRTDVRFVVGGHVRFPHHTGAIHGALRWLLRQPSIEASLAS